MYIGIAMDFTENYLRARDTAEKLFTKRKLGGMADTCDSDGSKHGLPMFSSQDEGDRIKRKFLSEFSPDPPSSKRSSKRSSPSLLTNSPRYEVLEEKYQSALSILESLGELAGQAKEELDSSMFPEWKDPMIPQIEELLIESFSATYRISIIKIVMCGYSEEIAKCAVLRSGPYIGFKDIVSSIVDGALIFLKREKEFDTSKKCRMFEDFDNLVEYMVLEMTCMLREVIPSIPVADAMYCLLMFDLNLWELTCVLTLSADEQVQGESSSDSTLGQQVNSKPQKSEPDSHMLGSQFLRELQKKEKESRRKINVCHSKKYLLQQKTFQLERSDKFWRTSKAKLISFGACQLDKKPKPPEANPKTPMPMPQEKAKITKKPLINPPSPPKTADYYCAGAGIPYDESQGKYVARDKNDESILADVSRWQALQKEVQGWNNWANGMVKMATSMLIMDQAELQSLKLEKKNPEELIKEKQFLEENTIPKLEAENSILKKKAEDAKEKGLQEAAKVEKAVLREQEALKKSQSIENEKALLQDELMALKCKTRALQTGIEKSKAVINQSEVQRRHEEREKMKLIKQAENIRKERERIESVAKAKEERIEENAKKGLEKRKDEMSKMEEMMAGLKIKTEARKKESLKEEDECVMCMTKEKSVVFLPCRHQLLCVDCNETLKKKKGRKDCPTCRTLIQKRINVRFKTG